MNNFPELRMILNPSGCAYYDFPVASDQVNMFVQPAAKQGQYHQDYCDKVSTLEYLTYERKMLDHLVCFYL